MVETEKVCSHKVSSAPTELVGVKSNNKAVSSGVASKNVDASPTTDGKSHPSITRSTSAYYVFSSLPKVVYSVRPKTGYRNNVSRPRGVHDYYNVMWDPHIYRGTTTTLLTSSLKQSPDPEKAEERYRKRRGFASTSNMSNHAYNTITPTTTGGRTPMNRYRMTTKVTSRSRTFPPPQHYDGMMTSRHQVHVQTDEFLEDLTRDMPRGEVDAFVQTDPIEDDTERLLPSELLRSSGAGGKRRLILPEKGGIDASTQVLPGELISFDEQVQPIVEAVVGKILEQALLETMEEEEIAALKAQQNRFMEKRKEEERELLRLQEQQERISAEKERLRRHLHAHLQQHHQHQLVQNGEPLLVDSASLSSMLDGGMINLGAGGADGGVVSTSYLLELLPSVINSLRQEGLVTAEQIGDDMVSSYVPLWRSSSRQDSSDPLDDTDDNEDTDPFPEGCRSRVNSLSVNVDQEENDMSELGAVEVYPDDGDGDNRVDDCDADDNNEEKSDDNCEEKVDDGDDEKMDNNEEKTDNNDLEKVDDNDEEMVDDNDEEKMDDNVGLSDDNNDDAEDEGEIKVETISPFEEKLDPPAEDRQDPAEKEEEIKEDTTSPLEEKSDSPAENRQDPAEEEEEIKENTTSPLEEELNPPTANMQDPAEEEVDGGAAIEKGVTESATEEMENVPSSRSSPQPTTTTSENEKEGEDGVAEGSSSSSMSQLPNGAIPNLEARHSNATTED